MPFKHFIEGSVLLIFDDSKSLGFLGGKSLGTGLGTYIKLHCKW